MADAVDATQRLSADRYWSSPFAPQIPDSATQHLEQWLEKNGYADVAKDLDRFAGASVGGLLDPSKRIARNPIIVFNGWGDRVQHENTLNPFGVAPLGSHGMEFLLSELHQLGYESRAVFGITAGPGNWLASQVTKLDKDLVLRARRRLEALISYADAHAEPGKKLRFVSIGHSGGNLIRDAVVKGGNQVDENGAEYDIGPSLAHRFERAVMISTPRSGIMTAGAMPLHPLYSGPTGFQPGSEFIERLNDHPVRVADEVYTVWPMNDEVMGPALTPYVHPTCSVISGADKEDGHVSLLHPVPSHTTIKDFMAEVIAKIAADGEIPKSPVASLFPVVTQWVPTPVGMGYSPIPYLASGKLFDTAHLLSPAAGFLAMSAEYQKGMSALAASALEASFTRPNAKPKD
ncbi:MAG: hypothetical protein AAF658_03965 [Myxococcota bacterium]